MSTDASSFPAASDMIAVLWVINGRQLWWPAEVLHIESAQKTGVENERCGRYAWRIRYSSYREYSAEEAKVAFTVQLNPFARFVSSLMTGTVRHNTCSWVFKNDLHDSAHAQIDPGSYSASMTTERVGRSGSSQSAAEGIQEQLTSSPSISQPQQPSTTAPPLARRHDLSVDSVQSTELLHRSLQVRNVVPRRASTPRLPLTSHLPTSRLHGRPSSPSAHPSSPHSSHDIHVSRSTRIRKQANDRGWLDSAAPRTVPRRQFQLSRTARVPRKSGMSTDSVPANAPPQVHHPDPGGKRTLAGSSSAAGTTFQSQQHSGLTQPSYPAEAPDPSQAERAIDTEKDTLINSLKSEVQRLSRNQTSISTGPTSSSTPLRLSSSASSVLASLKWLLLKRIEKPLKKLQLSQLSERGVARSELTVRCDCDYDTFSNISLTLASYFGILSTDNSQRSSYTSSRICFHPDFARTQSGSIGVDNLSISFLCVSDIMDFIGVRDEDDFEKILSTEVETRTENFLQILGTLEIASKEMSDNDLFPGATTFSTTTTSNNTHTGGVAQTEYMTIFVGSAPVEPVANTPQQEADRNQQSPTSTYNSFRFEQVCAHFSDQKACYNTKWFAKSVPSSFLMPVRRGLQHDPDRTKHFILNWKQAKSPSTVKWSRDAHSFGSSFPGRIELSIPTVFTSSRSNVRALSTLLDNAIEDVLRQRIIMHKCRPSQPQH